MPARMCYIMKYRSRAATPAAVTIVFFTILLFGCSPSDTNMAVVDMENDDTPAITYRLYTEAGSDLVLSIPSDLDIDDTQIMVLYNYAAETARCRYSNGDPVPIQLAELSILYDLYYLFPDYLPAALDSLENVEEYVDYVQQFDRFTFYYPPEEYAEYKLFREGDASHIGFRYRCDGTVVSAQTPFLIDAVYPFTRAWIDGLQVDDIILSVNGTRIAGLAVETATDLFPKQEGTTVDLLVQRGSREITITTAAEEHIVLLLSPGTAYINVRSFTPYTGEIVKQDFQRLREDATAPIENVILDLRDNPGGSNAGMLQLIDFLIDQDLPSGTNPIMTMDGTYYHNQTAYLGDYEPETIGSFSRDAFVVLVDAGSASAAEITTAVLKYYDAATVMGVQTYGKGVSQVVFELLDGAGVWITAHYVYPPDGISFHQIGVSPDYVISDTPASFSQDPVLEKAIAFLETGEIPADESRRENLSRTDGFHKTGDPLAERSVTRGKGWK